MTQIDDVTASRPPEESWRDFGDWLFARRLTLGGVALITAQTAVASFVLSRAFFQQDDFAIAGLVARNLTWHLLFQNYGGHLMPGVFALAWLLVHNGAGYDWGSWCGILVGLQALAGLAMLRALRTLFGDRMLILVPLAVMVCSPLVIVSVSWWAAGVQTVPLLLALAMAVDQHVRYLRTGRIRNAVFAACWIGFGLAFNEKASAIPILLLALTSAFPLTGDATSWRAGLMATLHRNWRAWALYAALLAAEFVVYLMSLLAARTRPEIPPANTAVAFGWDLLRNTFVPGAFGGPWHWVLPPGVSRSWALSAYAATPDALLVWSWAAAAGVVLATLWYRARAGRAWSILFGWLLLVDIAPIVTGRLAVFGTLAAAEVRYLADAAPVLALCLALATLPLRGEADPYRTRGPASELRPGQLTAGIRRPRPLRTAAAVLVAAALLGGTGWTAASYHGELHPGNSRSYLSTATVALSSVPADSVIYPSQLPQQLAWHVLGSAIQVQNALAPIAIADQLAGERFQFTISPHGTSSTYYIFDDQGRLHPAAVIGPYTLPFRKQSQCFIRNTGAKLQLTANVIDVPLVLRVGYFSSRPVTLTIAFGGNTYHMGLTPSPLAYGYVPVQGAGNSVEVTPITPDSGICVSTVTIGNVIPSPDASPVPAKTLPG